MKGDNNNVVDVIVNNNCMFYGERSPKHNPTRTLKKVKEWHRHTKNNACCICTSRIFDRLLSSLLFNRIY